jgi:hypothetical protein
MLDSGSDSDSDSSSGCGPDSESFTGIEELIRFYKEDKSNAGDSQKADFPTESDEQDAAHNHDVAYTRAVTISNQTTRRMMLLALASIVLISRHVDQSEDISDDCPIT